MGALSLQGCALRIAENDVFRANEANRRDASAPLTLDGESTLPDWVTLGHRRHSTTIGSVAITLADAPGDRLILHCGGNASDRKSDGVSYLKKLTNFGDVLIFDYPGYGDSQGQPTTPHFEAAVAGVAARARALMQERALSQIIVWGHSLGGFVCSRMAAQLHEKVSHVVLEASARSAQQVAEVWTPWYATPFVSVNIAEGLASYDNAQALSRFGGKVLVLGAGKDRTLPPRLSRRLHDALQVTGADASYREFSKADHFDIGDQPGFHELINAFLDGEGSWGPSELQ